MTETMTAVIPNVGLDGPDGDLLKKLLDTWQKKRPRNLMRTVYYEGKNALRDFGIAIPPQMQRAFTPLQEIAKGVHAMTDRSVFEGFISSGSDDPFGLAEILDANDFESEFPMATTSSAIHSCAFLVVTEGDTQAGEPPYLVVARSAEWASAVWDPVRRALAGFLAIMDRDDLGPTQMVMVTPETVYSFSRTGGRWAWSSIRNRLGEVSVARVVLQPELGRPFGHSRVSRTSMGLTDAMVRTILRAEVSAEFYAADQYWLFGAEVTKFIGDDKWSAVMGRMNAIDTDDGEDIKIQRFAGASPQPHTEQLRMLKSLFADDQSLEVRWADASNPSSADAIYAAKEELIMKTRNANLVWGRGAVKAMQMVVRLRDGLDAPTSELRRLKAQFTDPAIVSPSARADAFSKLSTNIDGFAESPVGWKYAGLPMEDYVQFQAWKQRRGAGDRISELIQAVGGARGNGGGVPGGDAVAGGIDAGSAA